MAAHKETVESAAQSDVLPPKPFDSMADEQWAEHVKGLREIIENWDPATLMTLEEAMGKLGIQLEDVTLE